MYLAWGSSPSKDTLNVGNIRLKDNVVSVNYCWIMWLAWITAGNMPTSYSEIRLKSQIARFKGPTWDPAGADRTQVGPTLAPWTLLSEKERYFNTFCVKTYSTHWNVFKYIVVTHNCCLIFIKDVSIWRSFTGAFLRRCHAHFNITINTSWALVHLIKTYHRYQHTLSWQVLS